MMFRIETYSIIFMTNMYIKMFIILYSQITIMYQDTGVFTITTTQIDLFPPSIYLPVFRGYSCCPII